MSKKLDNLLLLNRQANGGTSYWKKHRITVRAHRPKDASYLENKALKIPISDLQTMPGVYLSSLHKVFIFLVTAKRFQGKIDRKS